jgi:hypothetical protein
MIVTFLHHKGSKQDDDDNDNFIIITVALQGDIIHCLVKIQHSKDKIFWSLSLSKKAG